MYNKAIKDECDIVICDYYKDINERLEEVKFASFKDTNLKENPEIMADVEKKVRENFEKAFEQSLGEEEKEDDDDDVVVLVDNKEKTSKKK